MQSYLFVQYWSRTFLVQYQLNWNNAGFCSNWLLNINHPKIKIDKKWPDVQMTLHWIFSCTMLSGASRTIMHRVSPVKYCPRSINISQDLFLYNVVFSLLDNIAQGFDLCNVIPRGLQHYEQDFSCVMLSGASRTTT